MRRSQLTRQTFGGIVVSSTYFLNEQRPTLTPVTPPKWPAVIAAMGALAAVALIPSGGHSLRFAVTGYALGALLVPIFTVLYRFARQKAATHPFYVPRITLERLVLASLLLGITGGLIHAWLVATELAKR